MKQSFVYDERMQILSGKIAMIILSLTQLRILEIILYRRYFIGQGEENYADLRIIANQIQ